MKRRRSESRQQDRYGMVDSKWSDSVSWAHLSEKAADAADAVSEEAPKYVLCGYS